MDHERTIMMTILVLAVILISTASAQIGCTDSDGDGFGVCPNCDRRNGCEHNGHDCDDASASINPGAEELCDGIDNDCSRLIDDSPDCKALRMVCLVMWVAAPIAMILIALGGLFYILARYEITQKEQAKNLIRNGILGIAVILVVVAAFDIALKAAGMTNVDISQCFP